MSRRFVLAWAVVALIGASSRAQSPFPRDLVPTRSSLARLGLERQWMAVVPLAGDEHLLGLSMANDLIFAQTDKGFFHAFNAESGQHLWASRLGMVTGRVRPASVNSFAVFVTNLNQLYALDRRTGVKLWQRELNSLPSSATACDEERVMVGLQTGKVYGFGLKITEDGRTRLSNQAIDVWNWQTGATMETRPLPAGKFVVFGSDDGKIYVALADEHSMLYRIPTGGPIGQGFATHGTRTLLAPSGDNNLYAIDLFTAQVLWSHPSGAPIQQEPMVAGDDVFVVNTAGQLTSVDVKTGSARWTNSTQGGRLIAIGAKRIYLESHDEDLFIIDRATGQTTADPQTTLHRAGLNLRPYDYGITNRFNDRLYFATASGLIIALREDGQLSPRPLRDSKEVPFGTIPAEGVSLTPKATPVAEPTAPPAEGTAPPPAPATDAPK
jgi:outer membrane protein assembly factor BamB